MLFFKKHRTTRQVALGQSSSSHSDAVSALRSHFGSTNDSFHDFIELIEKLAITTPNVSQALSRTVLLGNTGHEVIFEGLSKAQEAKAQEEINRFAKDVFKMSAGIGGCAGNMVGTRLFAPKG